MVVVQGADGRIGATLRARGPLQPSAHVAVVRVLMATGNLGRALEAADEGLRWHPTNPSLGLLRGVLDHRFGRSDLVAIVVIVATSAILL